ncbi:PorP/SprF family type IX secretion system membrane protein [Portibacter marinus]|uniref:PorP/SprF family type IX secretion system membrane protein n=1 Tax=Portibacter marinus TaxID=2898660 RepID=UPI001F1680A7|nr:PorP/SprF family type IX secretion system membrane protein [Portibacter marinus]
MSLKNYILIFFSVLMCAGLGAQDIHFSQFYMSPLNLNPAMTGVMNCNTRFVANYRNQWASALGKYAYNTYSASYDQKVPVGRSDYFGIGGSFFGDVAGSSRFGTQHGGLSLSYSKKMGGYRKKSHYLVIGAQAALGNRGIRQDNLQWGTQHDGNGGFDPTLADQENLARTNFLWGDINAGLMWFSVLDQNTSYYVGGAFHHLNQPNQSFYSGVFEALASRFTFHAGGTFLVRNRISLVPNVVMMFQGPHREFNLGTSLRFAMGRSQLGGQSWQAGAWARVGREEEGGAHMDAIILATRFDYEQYGIGFSYDINVSSFTAATRGNGAFEFSFIYTVCGPENRGVYCPKF